MRLYRRCTCAGSALAKGELSYVAKTVTVNSQEEKGGRGQAASMHVTC